MIQYLAISAHMYRLVSTFHIWHKGSFLYCPSTEILLKGIKKLKQKACRPQFAHLINSYCISANATSSSIAQRLGHKFDYTVNRSKVILVSYMYLFHTQKKKKKILGGLANIVCKCHFIRKFGV